MFFLPHIHIHVYFQTVDHIVPDLLVKAGIGLYVFYVVGVKVRLREEFGNTVVEWLILFICST